jgi:hypothetical protein
MYIYMLSPDRYAPLISLSCHTTIHKMTTGDLAQEQPLPEDAFVSLRYLKRAEIYKHLRPYTLACKVDDGFPTNNLVFEYGPKQLITDIRGLAHMSLSLEKNGFCNVRNDFKSMANDEESITRPGGYLDELKALTRDTFKSQGLVAEDVRVINWVVSLPLVETWKYN